MGAATVDAEPRGARAPDRPGAPYRADLDGLRALAIVLVVAFHAEIPGFSGGFIGVDVFFVLSGWLITRQLVAPLEGGAPRSLLTFWAGRIRRLVPAMSVMILVVFGLSLVMLSPLEWHLIAARGAAAALYVSNLLFARSAGDYFSGTLQSSPYLHTWSLGVEEQFYLVWPLIFAITGRVASSHPTRARRGAIVAIMAAGAGSFALCLLLTEQSPHWAFYGLPSRAWEFAAGALAVVLWPSTLPLSARWWRLAPLLGVLLIAGAAFSYDGDTVFPGLAALVPVVGTLLIVVGGQAAGAAGGPVERGLVWPPARRLGRLSYSWYLWHWPFIVLVVEWSYTNTPWIRTGAALAALPVAALSLRFVEQPVRTSPTLQRSRSKTFVLGAVVTGLVLASAVGVELASRLATEREPMHTYAVERSSFSNTECTPEVSPGGRSFCSGGDPNSDVTVMLIGDSHAMQWMDAVSEAGRAEGVHVVVRRAGSCSAVAPLPGAAPPGVLMEPCLAYQRETAEVVQELDPEVVILSDALGSRDLLFEDDPDRWAEAFTASVDELERGGASVAMIRDNPISNDPLLCLARGRGTSYCTPRSDEALKELDRYQSAESRALQRPEGKLPVMDLTDAICGPKVCPLRSEGSWVFAASSHLTRGFTLTQVEATRDLLRAALDRAAPS